MTFTMQILSNQKKAKQHILFGNILLLQIAQMLGKASLGHELKKVTDKAFVFSVISKNQEKTKPLTWLSVSSKALQLL